MGDKAAQIRTTLGVKDCAEVFRRAAGTLGNPIARLLGKLGTHDSNSFFTPRDTSAFAVLDDDKPDFSVGVGVSKFNGGAKGNASFVQMHVWERGNLREVLVHCVHAIGGGRHAQRSVEGFTTAFQNADPACELEVLA